MSESMDPSSDPDGGDHRYHVGLPYRCHACTAIADAAEPYNDPDKTRHPHALRFTAERIPRGAPPPT